MKRKLINEKDDPIFIPDDVDYNTLINRQDYRFFKKDQKITHKDLLPPINEFDEDI